MAIRKKYRSRCFIGVGAAISLLLFLYGGYRLFHPYSEVAVKAAEQLRLTFPMLRAGKQ